MREWGRRLQALFSRVLAGGAAGCALLLVADLLFITPFWRPLYKSDHEGWERVFWVAKFGLPAALAVGAVAGLGWRWSRPFRLGPVGLVGCCLAVALVSSMLRPEVARVHRGGPGPLYEVVPDTIAAMFASGALIIVAVGAAWHLGRGLLRARPPAAEGGA